MSDLLTNNGFVFCRKMLMLALANPPIDIFDHIEKSVHDMLAVHWTNFCYLPSFRNLPKLILEEKQKLEKSEKSGKMQKSALPRVKGSDPEKIQSNGIISGSMFPKIQAAEIVTRLFAPFSRPSTADSGAKYQV